MNVNATIFQLAPSIDLQKYNSNDENKAQHDNTITKMSEADIHAVMHLMKRKVRELKGIHPRKRRSGYPGCQMNFIIAHDMLMHIL